MSCLWRPHGNRKKTSSGVSKFGDYFVEANG